jgi:hypothetical protein
MSAHYLLQPELIKANTMIIKQPSANQIWPILNLIPSMPENIWITLPLYLQLIMTYDAAGRSRPQDD